MTFNNNLQFFIIYVIILFKYLNTEEKTGRRFYKIMNKNKIKNKIFVAGIAGGSASGKSTLCEKLEGELREYKVAVIHMDSYFKPERERPRPKTAAFVTGREYADDNHPESLDLRGLERDMIDIVSKNENGHDILIAEGLLTLWDDTICNLLDLKIFVDCKPDERIVRRLRRNMQWGLSFDEIGRLFGYGALQA